MRESVLPLKFRSPSVREPWRKRNGLHQRKRGGRSSRPVWQLKNGV